MKTDKEKLEHLLKLLNDRSDTVDDSEGQPMPNQAMSILTEYDGWLEGWIK